MGGKKALISAGVQIKVVGNSGGLGKLHHKMMTIDDMVSIFGSFNYTGPANKSNDENILIIGDKEEGSTQAIAGQRKIAVAARKEIDRIRNTV